MLSPEIESLADRLFAADKRNRHRHLSDRLQSLTSEATLNGQIGAGRFHALIVDAYVQELRTRVELLWDTLQRVLSAEGIVPSEDLTAAIKTFLTPRIARECSELTELASSHLKRFQAVGSMQARVTDELRPTEDGLFARVDLFTKELRRVASAHPASGPVQNFYASTVGVVQTGQGATAAVHQNVVLGDTRATEEALDGLAKALTSVTEAAGYSQRELLELVFELAGEIRKPQPNRLKVNQMATGLGVALQTVAAVKPAYELVRTAFLGWGIHLPMLP